MERIIGNLFVGSDKDYELVKDKKDWSVLRTCKEGTGGHRDTLGYTAQSAPKGKNYLFVDGLNHRALNFIDPDDPNFIPLEMIKKGLDFINKRLEQGDKVLIACNKGESRGPTTAMLYLRSIGELEGNFHHSENVFRTLCPTYNPGIGMRTFASQNWAGLKDSIRSINEQVGRRSGELR